MFRFLFLLASLLLANLASGQTDSLILKNGDLIVGELKSMDQGVLVFETDYSDSDFKIEWKGVQKVIARQRYLISMEDGQRINGTFRSTDIDKIFIDNEEGEDRLVSPHEIVYIKTVDATFLSRLSANIDLGTSLTKANNQRQINSNFRVGYLADRWSSDLYYNTLFTSQDDAEDIERNDAGLGYRFFLPKDYYLTADINMLSNTEQSLELRSTGRIGIGHYLIHTNQSYFGFNIGGAYNSETFTTTFFPENDSTYTAPRRKSFEGFITTELNLYDIGDLDLFTNITYYPSIVAPEDVEPGRYRIDFRFDAKYDDLFIDDFYIRAGFTLNYDNRPAEEGKELDYIFSSGFGWKW